MKRSICADCGKLFTPEFDCEWTIICKPCAKKSYTDLVDRFRQTVGHLSVEQKRRARHAMYRPGIPSPRRVANGYRGRDW